MHSSAASAIRNSTLAVPLAPPDVRSGRVEERDLGSVRIARFDGSGEWHDEGADMCRLVFQRSSRSLLGDHLKAPEFPLSAGHWIAHAGPSLDIRNWWSSDLLSIAFPAELLSRNLLLQVQASWAAPIRTGGAARMCVELARTCLAQADPVSDAVNATLGDALVDLAKLALIEQSCGRRGETIRETVRARILGYINRNLADPDLTIERIAERMQCTKRYLHKVFSENGETLNQYIWSRRLDLCRTSLARPDLGAKSITEIAFACGFSNAAHFSRSFRARFGESPRAFRRAALGT